MNSSAFSFESTVAFSETSQNKYLQLSAPDKREIDTVVSKLNAISASDSHILLLYGADIKITSRLFLALKPQQWLNDEVINYHLHLLNEMVGDDIFILNTIEFACVKDRKLRFLLKAKILMAKGYCDYSLR